MYTSTAPRRSGRRETADETPADETPAYETSADETSADETPADDGEKRPVSSLSSGRGPSSPESDYGEPDSPLTSPVEGKRQHRLEEIPRTPCKEKPCKPCRVCKRKSNLRKDTRYQCRACVVPLCAVPCHYDYHYKQQYWL